MRYIDEHGNFIPEPDPSSGWGEETEIFIQHHDEEPAVEEVWHYEVIAEYPNGGKDVAKVIDVPGHPYIPAWDEYETVTLWHFNPPLCADRNYASGEITTIGDAWYEILTNIPAGARVTGQNAREVPLEELFNSIKEQT